MSTILEHIKQNPGLAVFALASVVTLANVVTFACGGNDLLTRRNNPLRASVALTVFCWSVVWYLYR